MVNKKKKWVRLVIDFCVCARGMQQGCIKPRFTCSSRLFPMGILYVCVRRTLVSWYGSDAGVDGATIRRTKWIRRIEI